jgi:hypothetical protein
VVSGGDLGVCVGPEEAEGFNFEPLEGGIALGLDESFGVVGRRPLIVDGC